ncbi:MAG: NPCBM/NEW2 domain-containing protein [Planctomycetes bacterium]|nr:NPCBM/NEW2 domain-containing protein [Planctomycetota bacterium]
MPDRRRRAILSLTLTALAFLPSVRADFRVADVEDRTRSVTALRLEGAGSLVCTTSDGKEEILPLADVVEISFSTTALPISAEFAVTLTTGDFYVGKIASETSDGFTLTTEDFGGLSLPLTQVRRIERFRPQIEPAPALKLDTDSVSLVNGDHDSGTVTKVAPVGVTIKSSLYGKEKTYAAKDLDSIDLVELEAPPVPPTTLLVTLRGLSGSRATGTIEGLKDQKLAFKSMFGVSVSLSVSTLSALHVRNGRCVFLSDLDPQLLVETFEGPLAPPPDSGAAQGDDIVRRFFTLQRDRISDSRSPAPLRLRKAVYRKGLGVFPACTVTYGLAGGFREFRATLGIDDASIAGAYARFTVLADGKEIFRSERLRAGGDPQPVKLDVKGVQALTLHVESGDGWSWPDDEPPPVYGAGTYADWAEARVIR